VGIFKTSWDRGHDHTVIVPQLPTDQESAMRAPRAFMGDHHYDGGYGIIITGYAGNVWEVLDETLSEEKAKAEARITAQAKAAAAAGARAGAEAVVGTQTTAALTGLAWMAASVAVIYALMRKA